LLTVMRLVAVPVMVACLLVDNGAQERWRWIAWLVFAFAAATDALDGYLARRWEAVSSFGKLADPLADKALVLAALVMIAVQGETPWWPVIVVAIREAGVTIGRLAVARDVVIPASAGGKLKTALQVLAIMMLLLPTHAASVHNVGLWVLYASVVVAVATGVDYAWRIGRIAMSHRVRSARRASALAGGSVVAEAVVDTAVVDTAEAMGEGGHGS
jgi:CDP-diacylglycerol--glycerol-3-phosphate 3-phosphatidyltransferase